MDIFEYTLKRLDFHENNLRAVLNEIHNIKTDINEYINSFNVKLKDNIKNNVDVDVDKILNDESYRMEIALSKTTSHTKACHLLGMNKRTFYRKLKDYKIREKLQMDGYKNL